MKNLVNWLKGVLASKQKSAPEPSADAVSAVRHALSLHQSGRIDDAMATYRRILAIEPNNFDALHLSGVAAKQLGRDAEAIEQIEKALAINPMHPEACNNLGAILKDVSRLDDAETMLRKAIELKPDYGEAHNNLGIVLLAQGDQHEAEACFRKAIEVHPHFANAMCNLGETCLSQGKLDAAEELYQQALGLDPNSAPVLNGMGEVYLARNKPDEAKNLFRKVIVFAPEDVAAHINLGRADNARGLRDEAERHYRNALALDPTCEVAKYNLSTLALLRGHYEEGWAFYESRFDAFPGRERTQTELSLAPRWHGEGLAGRRIMVWAEQGLGDSIMTMRYLSLLKARGASHVTFCCPPSLIRLALSLPDVDLVLPLDERPDADGFDVHCPIMSLPHLFGTTLDTIPDRMPYLHPQRQLAEQWQQRLTQLPRPRVGLVWAGSKTLRDDAKRSIPLHQFAPLRQIRDIQFISLQKGEEAAQLAASGWEIPDWMDLCGDLMDTAALIDNLDLVISVDTAVVHLAGALAKPVWLLNRFESEWRWGIGKERSPWYPSMRIFNQTEARDWNSAIERVAVELEKMTSFSDARFGHKLTPP